MTALAEIVLMRAEQARGTNLIQVGFDCRLHAPHSLRMQELNDSPRRVLVAAVFWTIVGLIVYAGFWH